MGNSTNARLPLPCRRPERERGGVRKIDAVPARGFSKEHQKFRERIAGTSRRGGRRGEKRFQLEGIVLAKALKWQSVERSRNSFSVPGVPSVKGGGGER